MTPTEQALAEVADQQGWYTATQLDLALEYIDRQQSLDAWRDFLLSVAATENEEAPK